MMELIQKSEQNDNAEVMTNEEAKAIIKMLDDVEKQVQS